MGKVLMHASVSVDGFIARPDDTVGPLFDWYGNGDVEVTYGDGDRVFRTSAASAEYIRRATGGVGAEICGRHLFDLTNGWDGRPPNSDAVIVVTHAPPTEWNVTGAPFEFVDGVAEAVARAREIAGDRDVSITPGDVGGQAFRLGLVDRVCLDLVPVVLGSGVRYFGDFTDGPALLGDPTTVVQGERVMHLVFDVLHRGRAPAPKGTNRPRP